MTDNDTIEFRTRELEAARPRLEDDYKPSIKVTAPGGESKWMRITPAEYFRVVEALTTEPPITYRVQAHDITTLTWPMWEACGIECPKMIGAGCPRGIGTADGCPGWSSKWDNAATEVVYGWTLRSDQSDTCGDVDQPIGWNALFRNPDRGTHDGPMGAGVILTTDSQGFVTLTRYDTVEERDADWSELQEEEAKFERANCYRCTEGQDCIEHGDEGN